MPIKIQWSRERYKKSIWRIDCPFARIGSDGGKILWFNIGRSEKKKSVEKAERIEKNNAIDYIEFDNDKISKKKKAKKSRGKKFDIAQLKEIYHQKVMFKESIHALYIFLKKIVLSFNFDKFNSLDIKLSLEQPEELGIVCGIVYPIIYSFPRLKWIHFEPDFENFDDDAEIFGIISFHIRFYNIISSLIIFIWKLPKIKLYKFWRKNRKKKTE